MIRKRKNRRKKKLNSNFRPAPFAAVVVVITIIASVYSYLQYSCQQLGNEIKALERQKNILKTRYMNEECRWMEDKSPENIKKALNRYNIVMQWPSARQVVRLRTPVVRNQSIASLDSDTTRRRRLAGAVMND